MVSTTIALSRSIYNRLQDVKHKLEKEKRCNCSFGETIEYLLERIEKNG